MQTLSFCQNNDYYARFVDSADVYIDTSSKKALIFLDSIPKPLEKNIEGRLADYYSILALIQSDSREGIKQNQSYISALKYGKKEKNFRVAGEACLELFSNIYFIKKDTTAYSYLSKAKHYYELSNYENGILEVEQMYAYIEFLDGHYMACNDLILSNISKYRASKDDMYFLMFATYMLASNYVYLEDFKNAHKYFDEFKKLKDNPEINLYNYSSFAGNINLCFADVYFERKQMDSTRHYLNKSKDLLTYMGEDGISEYYLLWADYYNISGDISLSRTYIDSLKTFEAIIFNKTVDASFEINDSLSKAEEALLIESENKFFSNVLVILFGCIIVFFSFFYFFINRRNKNRLDKFENQASNFSYLKSNHDKLAIKVQGLEDYINNLKKEIKLISTLDDTSQRERIKEFYINLKHNSSTVLDKTENHLELVNDLNVDFFKQLQDRYPSLNNSETIICYYLFIGFNTNEIAVFLNSSVRAIESKRYRTTKKLGLEDTSLLDHLKNSF